MKKSFYLLSLLALPFLWAGCNDDSDPDNANLPAKLEIRMTDAPALYDEVNIEVLSISVHADNEEGSGWIDYNLAHPGIYNLLDYQNGVDTLLVTEEIPAGKIKEIRLILGENNSVVIDGEEHKLTTPSAQQSGLKFKFGSDVVLEPGKTYRLWIDFDASRSIHSTGSGKYMLKPVIRAFAEAYGGSITGQITPPDLISEVKAILETDTLTTYPKDGKFAFIGLEPSVSWKLQYFYTEPEKWGKGDYTETPVVVAEGKTTEVSFKIE